MLCEGNVKSVLRKKWFKRLRAILFTLILLAMTAVGIYAARRAWTSSNAPLSPLMMTIQPREFKLMISANGELQSEESLAIGMPPVPVFRLKIASVVSDGRHINKGDTLVEFDPAELDLQMLGAALLARIRQSENQQGRIIRWRGEERHRQRQKDRRA